MALSMDEQRMLAEIERRLSADDPGLATCLTTFRRPGPATVLRSPRARIIGSLFTVLLVAMVSLMVYAMIPFRAHMAKNNLAPGGGLPSGAAITATGTHLPGTRQQASISATSSISPTTHVSSTGQSNPSASGTASGKTQAPPVKHTSVSESPLASP
jgi:Protein of unknown function (DUF3040)